MTSFLTLFDEFADFKMLPFSIKISYFFSRLDWEEDHTGIVSVIFGIMSRVHTSSMACEYHYRLLKVVFISFKKLKFLSPSLPLLLLSFFSFLPSFSLLPLYVCERQRDRDTNTYRTVHFGRKWICVLDIVLWNKSTRLVVNRFFQGVSDLLTNVNP